MPQWIHSRVKHIMSKNPDMPESEAWAIATQQSHALGKTPKGYGTVEGKEKAQDKYKTPGDDEHKANPKTASILGELQKLRAVIEEQARRSMDRLDTLEKSKPTMGQMGRYAAIGAAAGPAVKAVSNLVKGKPLSDFGQVVGSGVRGALRGVAGDAAAGAAAAGAVPLLRGHLDRKAEIGTLKKYVHQYHNSTPHLDAETGTPSPVAPVTKQAARIAKLFPRATSAIRRQSWDLDKQSVQAALGRDRADEKEKKAFEQSMYGSTGGFVDFNQTSSQPGFRRPHPSASSFKKTPDALHGVKAASFLTEEESLYKLASDVNIGQWWDQVGGPHLAKGGSHEEFHGMMNSAGIPPNVQSKFKRIAAERYPRPSPFQAAASAVKFKVSPEMLNRIKGTALGAAGVGGALGGIALAKHVFSKPKKKEAGIITPTGITPASRVASSMRIGAPKITSPSGPSIGDIAKPKGFGSKISGATKA